MTLTSTAAAAPPISNSAKELLDQASEARARGESGRDSLVRLAQYYAQQALEAATPQEAPGFWLAASEAARHAVYPGEVALAGTLFALQAAAAAAHTAAQAMRTALDAETLLARLPPLPDKALMARTQKHLKAVQCYWRARAAGFMAECEEKTRAERISYYTLAAQLADEGPGAECKAMAVEAQRRERALLQQEAHAVLATGAWLTGNEAKDKDKKDKAATPALPDPAVPMTWPPTLLGKFARTLEAATAAAALRLQLQQEQQQQQEQHAGLMNPTEAQSYLPELLGAETAARLEQSTRDAREYRRILLAALRGRLGERARQLAYQMQVAPGSVSPAVLQQTERDLAACDLAMVQI